jgi:hypothetical protein
MLEFGVVGAMQRFVSQWSGHSKLDGGVIGWQALCDFPGN